MHHHRGGQHQRQHRHHLNQAEHAQADAFGIQIGEELRATAVAQRKDEHHKEDVFDAGIHRDIQLTNQQRGNQRAADATQLDRPKADLPDGIAKCQGQKDSQSGNRL